MINENLHKHIYIVFKKKKNYMKKLHCEVKTTNQNNKNANK